MWLRIDCMISYYCICGYFCLMLFSPCYTCNLFYLVLNSPRIDCITLKWKICPVLNSPSDNGCEIGKNKVGIDISMYIVSILFTSSCICLLPGSKRLHREVWTGGLPPSSVKWYPFEEELSHWGNLWRGCGLPDNGTDPRHTESCLPGKMMCISHWKISLMLKIRLSMKLDFNIR